MKIIIFMSQSYKELDLNNHAILGRFFIPLCFFTRGKEATNSVGQLCPQGLCSVLFSVPDQMFDSSEDKFDFDRSVNNIKLDERKNNL
jgi:hypothetical protein